MRCSEVREVLSGILDRNEEPFAADALEHTENCRECAGWFAEVQAAHSALDAGRLAIPVIDLSAAIMAGLPSRHPASRDTVPVLTRRKLITVMVACWLLGAVMMAIGVGFWTRYSGGPHHAVAVSAKVTAGAAGSVASSTWETCRALFYLAVGGIVQALARNAHGLRIFLIIDTLLLLLAALVWRRRRTIAGPFCLIP